MSLNEAITAIGEHRDKYYPEWSKERGILNFCLILLKQVQR